MTPPVVVLRTVCAWCPPDVAPMDGQGPIPPGTEISHGLCPACRVRLEARL